jgi:hypothetical protein
MSRPIVSAEPVINVNQDNPMRPLTRTHRSPVRPLRLSLDADAHPPSETLWYRDLHRAPRGAPCGRRARRVSGGRCRAAGLWSVIAGRVQSLVLGQSGLSWGGRRGRRGRTVHDAAEDKARLAALWVVCVARIGWVAAGGGNRLRHLRSILLHNTGYLGSGLFRNSSRMRCDRSVLLMNQPAYRRPTVDSETCTMFYI